ncbi:MAG: AAA family ATPase [Actinomycetaceae bacterium]|nr:AAA family ATPase [Actinomycetaceae bacterium]
MQQTIKYPIGLQDFRKIRDGSFIYVDKTALIKQLIDDGSYYFLSRPRRFGKSLLLSTIAAYFRGEQDLFKGLAITQHTAEWVKHPVLHLDLGGKQYQTPDDLKEHLHLRLQEWEQLYGANEAEKAVESRFRGIIQRACKRTGQQVVILVDEYDKPLLESAGNEALQEHYRATLRAFYFNLKSCDASIKFALLTGVTKFSKLSVFSDLNNLNDISMQREYGAICGITESELETYFAAGISKLAQRNGMSVDEARARLKRQYDGYLFEEDAEHVYNPFSLLNALNKSKLGDYWFTSGTPNFLAHMLRQHNFELEKLPDKSISADRLSALDTLSSNPLPILYQSGYLTLGGKDDMGNYYLRFPNEEVERSFLQLLVPVYTAKDGIDSDTLIIQIVRGLRAGKPNDVMCELQALLADIPYEQGKPPEAYFRNLLFIIFRLVGFYCEVEHPMAGGRLDTIIKTDKYIYVMEYKVDETTKKAITQIEQKGYAAPYAADKRTLFKIGVNFSSKSKQIDDWQVVQS